MNGVLERSTWNVTWKDIIWRWLLCHTYRNSCSVRPLAGSHTHASAARWMWCCSSWRRASFEAEMPLLLSLSLSLSLSLPSLRGCLKLPSLTLFTFSLFCRYREEMAWNPAVFRTLDKLHSHSKWIYINKEADTWKRRERERERKREREKAKGDEATKDGRLSEGKGEPL